MTLTGNLTGLMFQYVTNASLPEHKRQFVAVAIKNIVKKAYGQHTFTHYEEQQKREGESVAGDESDPQSFIDAASLQQIQTNIVTLAMQCADKSVQVQLLECISLMGKRYVQNEWPNLIPELAQHI